MSSSSEDLEPCTGGCGETGYKTYTMTKRSSSESSGSGECCGSCCSGFVENPDAVRPEFYPEKGQIPLTFPELYDEVLNNNNAYAMHFIPQNSIPPSKHAVVVTCMDARLMPDDFMGYDIGQFHCIRNAGGRVTDDVLRSLMISEQLLGTDKIFVVHHQDCGMLKFNNLTMDELMAESLVAANLIQTCNTNYHDTQSTCVCKWSHNTLCESFDTDGIDWKTIQHGLKQSVIEDVTKLRNFKGIPPWIEIYGLIFVPNGTSVKLGGDAGRLIPVKKANKIGKGKVTKCKC